MRQVQEALKDIGIPVIAGIWRATSENQNPPLQYVVYSSTTTETAFPDAADSPERGGKRTWVRDRRLRGKMGCPGPAQRQQKTRFVRTA